jgi:WD40 repeat protein
LQKNRNQDVWAVAISPSGESVASGGKGKHVQIWERIQDEQICRSMETGYPTTMLAFSPEGSQIAQAARLDKGLSLVLIWHTRRGEPLHFDHEQPGWITALGFSRPVGTEVLVGKSNGLVMVGDMIGRVLYQAKLHNGTVSGVAMIDDTLVSAGQDGRIVMTSFEREWKVAGSCVLSRSGAVSLLTSLAGGEIAAVVNKGGDSGGIGRWVEIYH